MIIGVLEKEMGDNIAGQNTDRSNQSGKRQNDNNAHRSIIIQLCRYNVHIESFRNK